MALDPSAARVAVVGVGGLGGALARGLLRSGLPASRITLCDVSAEKLGTVAGASGMRVTSDASEAARHADVVVVAVKPGDVAAAVDKVSFTGSTGIGRVMVRLDPAGDYWEGEE